MDNRKWKILIVDDQRSNLEVLTHILSADNYTLNVAKSGRVALRKALSDSPDLILLDIIMPDMNGFDVLSVLKESNIMRNIPVIIITGLDSIEDEEKGFYLGAVDYITKPFHKSLVKARIETHLRILEQMRTIEQIGLIDVLTNMPNRRSFNDRMAAEWMKGVRDKTELAFLMIDIDHFKDVNDHFGHQRGDVVLQAIAKVLTSSSLRREDFAARWGGEEFAVLLPHTNLKEALIIAENLRSKIESIRFSAIEELSKLHVTVSIGVTSAIPTSNGSISDFIASADKALYAAKTTGRNRVESLF